MALIVSLLCRFTNLFSRINASFHFVKCKKCQKVPGVKTFQYLLPSRPKVNENPARVIHRSLPVHFRNSSSLACLFGWQNAESLPCSFFSAVCCSIHGRLEIMCVSLFFFHGYFVRTVWLYTSPLSLLSPLLRLASPMSNAIV